MKPANGRGANGRFVKGEYPGGPGNPFARQVAQLRAKLLQSVTEDDVEKVAKRLVALAKKGNIAAIRELLDRCLGKPQQNVDLSTGGGFMEVVERIVTAGESRNGSH